VFIPSLILLVGVLVVLSRLSLDEFAERYRAWVSLTLIGSVAFFLAGPYTFCSGALAMSLGGVRGAAAAAGIIDTAGYLGAIAAGSVIGRVATNHGWNTAFLVLAGLAMWTTTIAIWYSVATSKRTTTPRND
jgi:MFS transporter, OPA family, glycerol-3-phosphate transporter